jgi:hypothetical protein
MSHKTQVTINGVPSGDFPTKREAKAFGKREIRKFTLGLAPYDNGIGGINIQYIKL